MKNIAKRLNRKDGPILMSDENIRKDIDIIIDDMNKLSKEINISRSSLLIVKFLKKILRFIKPKKENFVYEPGVQYSVYEDCHIIYRRIGNKPNNK